MSFAGLEAKKEAGFGKKRKAGHARYGYVHAKIRLAKPVDRLERPSRDPKTRCSIII
jgi:hypothetical protein